jgi:hypothetical protein
MNAIASLQVSHSSSCFRLHKFCFNQFNSVLTDSDCSSRLANSHIQPLFNMGRTDSTNV